jgi:hypothetical protein
LAGTELVPIVQGGVTEQTTVQAILTGTVPSGTANGVLYLNGSKVVTSGSGLTFDGTNFATTGTSTGLRLIASSTDAGGSVLQVDTTATAFGRVGGSTTMGYVAGTQSLWTIGGSEQMRLTSTGLGIGTNNPGAKLQVTGSGKGSIFGSGSAINFYSAWQYNSTDVGYVGNGASIVAGAASTDFGLTAFTSGKLWLGSNNGASYAVLDASGNLGLGVTPSAWGGVYAGALQVGRAVMHTNTGDFRASFGGNYYVDGTNARYIGDGFATQLMQVSGDFRFFTAPNNTSGAGAGPISFTQAMTLDASGNLGIGTTSPGAKLHIKTGDTTQGLRFENASSIVSAVGFTSTYEFTVDAGAGAGGAFLLLKGGAPGSTGGIKMYTEGAERIHVKYTGQVRFIPLAADPAGAENGDVYYNSSTNKLRLYAAGAWTDLN